jgi:DNA-binding CsgD family transcriptional regulator
MQAELRREKLLDVVGRFYDAAYDDSQWEGIAADLANVFDAPSAALHVRSASDQVQLLDFTQNLRITSERHRQDASYWRAKDLWVQRAKARPLGTVLLGQDLFAPAEFERTGFYQDWCRKQDQFHLVAALIPLPEGGAATFGIHRPRDAPQFGEDHRALAGLVLEHFKRAIVHRSRIQAAGLAQHANAQTVARSDSAVIVLAQDGTVLHASPNAGELLSGGDGLTIAAGMLRATLPAAQRKLAELVQRAALCSRLTGQLMQRTGEGSMSVPRRIGPPLTLTVAPLRQSGPSRAVPAALVLIRDPQRGAPDVAVLRELFGLTGAEANLAAQLACGRSVEHVARAENISLNTARSHVKHILAKTGTSRQAEAVALIQQSTAMLGIAADRSNGTAARALRACITRPSVGRTSAASGRGRTPSGT